MENKLTAGEILEKHLKLQGDLSALIWHNTAINAINEALQSQPPTVTDEEIEKMATDNINYLNKKSGWRGFIEGGIAVRNKLTPNK